MGNCFAEPSVPTPTMSFPVLDAEALSSKFPSLPLSKPLTGLYFAASWCPDCTPVTPKVAQAHQATSEAWNVVYIGSESTPEQVATVPTTFTIVPLEKEQERSDLKRHFGACASREAEPLQVNRKFGLPTLIILSTATGEVITTEGVEEIQASGATAVEKWKSAAK